MMTGKLTEIQGGWEAADLAVDSSWTYRLSPTDIVDLEQALAFALRANKSLFAMTPADFPLSEAFSAVLAQIMRTLQTGTGVYLLKGVTVSRWSTEQLRILFWGLGLHLGVARPQGRTSLYLTDVRDVGTDYRSSTGRGYNSNAALDFHTDTGDIVGLMCLRTAASGGESAIVSAIKVHNVMLKKHPSALQYLYEPMHFSRQGDAALDEKPYYRSSVFGQAYGHFAAFVRPSHHILNAQKDFQELPRLSSDQEQALEVLHDTIQDEGLCFRMYLEPGDIQFMNNYTVIHARTNYIDHAEPELKRHLMRLWLAVPQGQPLPSLWQDAMKDISPCAVRGGVRGCNITPEATAYEQRLAQHHGMRCSSNSSGLSVSEGAPVAAIDP